MSTARIKHSATVLQNGQVLAAGGVNATGFLTSAELYDPQRREGDEHRQHELPVGNIPPHCSLRAMYSSPAASVKGIHR